MHGETILVNFDGPTGTQDFDVGTEGQWRACTIALHMVPDAKNVPTMSEWGLIAFAAFGGLRDSGSSEDAN